MAAPDSAPPKDLHEWIERLRAGGELVEVECEVDARLEVPEIHRRVIAAGGPALLFRNVRGADFPLVVNLFGTESRVKECFGARPRELVEKLAGIPETLLPPSLGRLWEQRRTLGALLRVGTRRVRGGPVFEASQETPRLGALPVTTSWIRDGGPFLTLPLVLTRHPETHVPNLGMYRCQVFDDSTTGMHFQIGKGGGFHLSAHGEGGHGPMPVHVHLGGPPALILSAIAPLPENVPEPLLASLLAGRRLRVGAVEESPLPVFADAEFCLIGTVDPEARRPEGPFGDHYGYYSETHDYPVFDVRRVLHRRDAIFPATVVGKPRQEDFFLGDFVQELLAPLFPLAMPGVRDLWSYGETGYHGLASAVVRDRYKREAMASAFRILGEGQLSLTKFLLVVDESIDLKDFPSVLTHVLERADFRTDLFLFANLSMDSLDYTGPTIGEGSKGVLLGLGDPKRSLPTTVPGALGAGVRDARVFSPGCLVVDGPPHHEAPGFPARVAELDALRDWPLIVVTDDAERATRSSANFLWTTFTRFDPAADVHARETSLLQNHACLTPPIVIDARMQEPYPSELFCDPDTARTVDARWKEYFPTARVEMGDSDRGHLD